jgi:hypothetical protein
MEEFEDQSLADIYNAKFVGRVNEGYEVSKKNKLAK